jgi:ketose-bisphosphate aldolase
MQIYTLNQVLPVAERGHYAIGSFAPRYTAMIRAVLRAGQKSASPLIVQISQRELNRYGIAPAEFADEFYAGVKDAKINVPLVLHLDHTKDFSVIEEAIESKFTSVMIDASDKPLDENIAISKAAAEYAHGHKVSIEAELGRIGRADSGPSDDTDEEKNYTDPQEAKRFVMETRVDTLAVSVGTAHGVYMTKQPKVDYERLKAIRALTPVHLVLHGGSGVPADMMKKAFQLPNGVSKVNIATDLELAMLQALGLPKWITNEESKRLSHGEIELGRAAVERTVIEKITDYVMSLGKAREF